MLGAQEVSALASLNIMREKSPSLINLEENTTYTELGKNGLNCNILLEKCPKCSLPEIQLFECRKEEEKYSPREVKYCTRDFTETDDQRYCLSYQGNCCPLALQAGAGFMGLGRRFLTRDFTRYDEEQYGLSYYSV